jgi:signal transduction protein with GAF and PtsI domain
MSDLHTELTRAVAGIRQLFGAAACSCALVTADDALTFVAADGAGAAAIIGSSIPLGKGLAGFAVLSGQPLAVADVVNDQRFARDVAERTDYIPSTILAAPMLAPDGEPLGVVEVLDPANRASDTGRDLDVLGALSAQVAVIVRLASAPDEEGDPELRALRESLASVVDAGPAGVRLAQQILSAVNGFQRTRR